MRGEEREENREEEKREEMKKTRGEEKREDETREEKKRREERRGDARGRGELLAPASAQALELVELLKRRLRCRIISII